MITLILSTFFEIQDYQKILAIISLVIDIIASIVLVIRVIKTKNMTPKDFEKIGKLEQENNFIGNRRNNFTARKRAEKRA